MLRLTREAENKQVNFRATPTFVETIAEVAKELNVPKSALIRTSIRLGIEEILRRKNEIVQSGSK